MCARPGSVIGLKAGSQSIGACLGIGVSEMELPWVGPAIGGSRSRSLLLARLIEIVTPAALPAVTGLVIALMPPAATPLKTNAAEKFLNLLLNV